MCEVECKQSWISSGSKLTPAHAHEQTLGSHSPLALPNKNDFLLLYACYLLYQTSKYTYTFYAGVYGISINKYQMKSNYKL